MERETLKHYMEWFMANVPAAICFLVILLVQLKIIRELRSQLNMIMFYGKQIEEVRKMLAGGGPSRRLPDIPPDEPGLYEVLKE